MAEKLFSYADKQVMDEVGSGGGGGGGGSGTVENVVAMTYGETATEHYVMIEKTIGELRDLVARYGVVYAVNSNMIEGKRVVLSAPIISVNLTSVMVLADFDEDNVPECVYFQATTENENPRHSTLKE